MILRRAKRVPNSVREQIMSKHTEKRSSKATSGRYEKLLKGEITSGQYVKSLQRDARSQRSAPTGRYSARRSAGA